MIGKEDTMDSWMEWLLLIYITVTNIVLSLFCCALLTSRCKWVHVLCLAALVPVTVIPLDVMNIADISAGHPIRSIIGISGSCIATLLVFKGSAAKKLLVLFLGQVLSLIPLSLFYLVSIGLGLFNFNSTYTEMNFPFFVTQTVVLALYALCCFFTARWIRGRKFREQSFRLLSCFVVIQLLLIYVYGIKAHWDDSMHSPLEFIFLVAVCAAADLAVFYLIREMDRKIRLEAEAKFYEKQLSMQLDLYRNFSAYTDGLQQVRRRLARELSQVCTALDRGDYNRVFDRSQHLQGDLENLKLSGYCKNSLLNAVLFMKQREMEVQEIAFQPVVQLEEETFVKRSDLCRIVSNLLDNAIEACTAAPAQSRLIRFTCMPVKHTLLIKTVNSFSGRRRPDDAGLPRSTKKETGHGYGLSSVRELIASYEGILDFRLDEKTGQAYVTVTLFEG